MQTTDDQRTHHRADTLIRDKPRQELRGITLSMLTFTRVVTGHAAEEAPELDPRTIAPRWALSPLDWLADAIDPWADHPAGVWIARCGYQLPGNTGLHDEPPRRQCRAVSGEVRQ